jgi:hypothetical protein
MGGILGNSGDTILDERIFRMPASNFVATRNLHKREHVHAHVSRGLIRATNRAPNMFHRVTVKRGVSAPVAYPRWDVFDHDQLGLDAKNFVHSLLMKRGVSTYVTMCHHGLTVSWAAAV